MSRILTAAAGVPVILAVILWGPLWLFGLLIAVTSALALDEYLGLGGGARPGYWFLPFGAALSLTFLGPLIWTYGVVAAAGVVLLVSGRQAGQAPDVAKRLKHGIGGLLYTCFLLGFLILLSPYAVLALLGIVWMGDSAAYYAGRRWGRRKLAPTVSPNKTVEGAVAGLLASTATGVAVGAGTLGLQYTVLAMISLLTAVAAQLGDLFESKLKRRAGVKDSSNRLPGHGGVLDRIDSLLFAAPVFYFLLRLV